MAQVAPGSETALRLVAARVGARLGFLRGLVQSRDGQPLRASVQLEGRAAPVPVDAAGRFSATLPAGRYVLRVSAPGHLTQVKRFELPAGEQALFHVELLPE